VKLVLPPSWRTRRVVGSRNNQEDERQVSEKYHFPRELYRKRNFLVAQLNFFRLRRKRSAS
jgi:hypothetical protein